MIGMSGGMWTTLETKQRSDHSRQRASYSDNFMWPRRSGPSFESVRNSLTAALGIFNMVYPYA